MFSLKKLFFTLTLTLILSSFSSAVYADTVTVFTTRTAFTAAAPGLSTIDFEGIAPTNSVANFPTGLTIQGLTFTGNATGMISVVDSGFFAPLFQYNSGASLAGFDFIDVALPPGITAFGADIMTTNPDGQTFLVILSNGMTFSVTTPLRPERGFFGFTSDVAIASIRFDTTVGIPLMDNVNFGQAAAAVPEPMTLVLLSTGLIGIGLRFGKRKRC